MQPHSPSIEEHQPGAQVDRDLPVLELPPVPFARPATAAPARTEAMPSGTAVQDLIGALTLDGLDDLQAQAVVDESTPDRPLHEFSVAVDRRGRRERRLKPRSTPDRREFTSQHMAAPDSGPTDPRPTAPPVHGEPGRAEPIDAVMPPLPLELEAARPYELPNRSVAAGTQRTTRASLATGALPFPQQAIDNPPPPTAAPEPPIAESHHAADADMTLPPVPDAPATPGIESIFGSPILPVGHLQPREVPATDPVAQVPVAGPAGPATAPGAGLDPVAAAVAAAPSAWYGGAVQVDDSMMIWNAPGTDAPLAPSVASLISPAPPVMERPASGALATTPLAPAATPAGAHAPGTSRSPLRLLLLVGIPAGAGIAIAFAINQFLL